MNFSCYLIGEDSLLIQCASLLLAHKHTIVLIISPTKLIQHWAEKHNISWVRSLDEFNKSDAIVVDYIFSIVNSHILPSHFIKFAKQATINYHDSLLPNYAGLNATTWAILNDEKQHGVTWHLVTEKIDGGDILVQHSFPIEETETALTLNLRCYEQAIASFSKLLDGLKHNNFSPRSQLLPHRHYFSKSHLLPELGFINWQTMSAEFISRLYRALIFGHYKNNVGHLKIYLYTDFFIVTGVQITDEKSTGKKSGTILNINPKELLVTIDNKIICLRFTTPINQVSSEEIINRYDLSTGMVLPSLPDNLMHRYAQSYQHALEQECFWIKKLQQTSEHNTFTSQATNEINSYQAEKTIKISTLLKNSSRKHTTTLLAGLMIYFFRLNNYEKTSVFLIPDKQGISQKELPSLFPCFIPLNLPSMKDVSSLEEITQSIGKKYKILLSHGGYLADIYSRQPELDNHVSPSIVISFSSIEHRRLPSSTTIYIHIDEKSDTIICYHRLKDNYQNGSLLKLISCFNDHIHNIVTQLITHPQTLINDFCFLNDSERQAILEAGCGDSYPLPTESLTTLFEKNVELYPNQPAILMHEERISYIELWQMAEAIANTLRKKITPKSLIGIYTIRSPVMIAIILGILKADCIYVPLDPKYPLGKINMIATDAQLTLIITSSTFFKKLSDYFVTQPHISMLNVEKILNNFSTKPFTSIMVRQIEERLAYIMFTSGTTGVPKGVMISQRNVINYCCWFSKTTEFSNQSTIDFSSSIAFDLSVPCTIAPLLVGGTIAICSEEEKINPQMYLEHLQHHKITHIELTPGYLELLLNYPEKISQLDNLKYLMLGADILHTSEVDAWLSLSPKTQIVNEYGPTEATVSVTSYFIQPDASLHTSTVPIGKPAFNSYCYVLDKYNNLCPFGMKGELHVGGEQIAIGYLGNKQTTSEKFVKMKFANQKPIRVYKTGDEVCWYPNGQLQFFGRNDFQVKIYGYRVELPAIETLIMQFPSIHQAVVVVKKHHQDKYLCAYLVAGKSTICLNELKDFLINFLPSYMLPKEYYLVDTIPLKENEKIDFESLENQTHRQLFFSPALIQDTLTSTQKYCLRTWQIVFNNQSIRLDDNFFDLGGDSLIALQIINSLKTYYSLPISLSCLFECPTVSSLANKIEQLLTNDSKKQSLNSIDVLIRLSTGIYPIPIFLIHPVGGSVFWYQQLAQHLDGKYTIYGIQDPSLENENMQFRSLQEMASFYFEAISTVYQGEQYCLGGASFGATVAFEMAYQLQQANLNVQFLGLMDGWAHYPPNLMRESALSLLSHSKEYLTLEQRAQLIKQEEYRQELLLNYSIPILTTDVTLFKARELWESFVDIDDPFNGWQPYVHGKITVRSIPGTHESMFFNSNVEEMAQVFDRCQNVENIEQM